MEAKAAQADIPFADDLARHLVRVPSIIWNSTVLGLFTLVTVFLVVLLCARHRRLVERKA
jgi:hypothetical protein